jgi:DNA (cytosine-5)-methyltransferase 1
MISVELFAGAGGLAIGMANAGFHHVAVVEKDHESCETFRENQRHHAPAVEGWPLYEIDARKFDYSSLSSRVAVVSGGPPCQPFSVGGKQEGNRDDRDMFPEAVRAIRELNPQAFIFENVKGLTHRNFAPYFAYLQLQLQHPELTRQKYERWTKHLSRLERHHTANKGASTYNVLTRVMNAADYGVAQRRERVMLVGFRSDIGAAWSFPAPTHSESALLASKWVDGTYWDRFAISRKRRPAVPPRLASKIEILRKSDDRASLQPWRTVREAICDLPNPEATKNTGVANHKYTPGARAYPGHTGSVLDEPAKTLKAGHHGVPGGENMFIKDDGGLRYFTVREAARLQSFPDEFEFRSSWTQTMRQLGNAVPVKLAEVVASSVARSLARCAKP